MPLLGWLEGHLLLLGIAALLAGFMLGIICSAIGGRRRKTTLEPRSRVESRRALERSIAVPAAPPTVARPRATEREAGDGNPPRVQPLRGPTPHRARGVEPIARIGPARRTRTPARRG